MPGVQFRVSSFSLRNPPLENRQLALGTQNSNLSPFLLPLKGQLGAGIAIGVALKFDGLTQLNDQIKKAFELQDENVLNSSYLLDYNLKPRKVVEILHEQDIESFCKSKNISTRGDAILNILDSYKDVGNIYLENYANIGFRDLVALKDNGIIVREVDLGKKFEELTKTLFKRSRREKRL